MGTKGIAAAVAAGALVLGVMAATNGAAAAPVNIIENGGFEAATAFEGWTVETQPDSAGTWCPQTGTLAPGVSSNKGGLTCGGKGGSGATVPAPPEGVTAAMTDQNDPSGNALYQCVAIPAGVTSAELSFQLYLNNDADDFHPDDSLDIFPEGPPKTLGAGRVYQVLGNGAPGANQQFRADIITPGGVGADPFTVSVLENVYQTQAGDPTESGYSLISADLSAYIGQTICVRFVEVDNQGFFNAGVDDVQLIVNTIEEPVPTTEPLSPPPEADEGPIAAPDTGSNDSSGGTRAMLWLALAALVVTATGAATLGFARRR